MSTDNNAPGMSYVYALARDLLAAIATRRSATVQEHNRYVTLIDGGDYRALVLNDADPLHPDTLALWAAAFEQPADAWRVDSATGGRVARLEWATDGEAHGEGSRVTWIGQGR